jgi:hypothetical protein
MSASPTSRYLPINTKLSYRQWQALNSTIKEKRKILSKLKRGMIDDSLWYMEQLEYLRDMKEFNLPYILGSLLNYEKQ